jgi:hypothetical protein
MDLFAERPKLNPEAAAALKVRVRQMLMLPEDAVVMITELRCTEPGCPPLETVIVVMADGESKQYKIHKAMVDLQDADLIQVLPLPL